MKLLNQSLVFLSIPIFVIISIWGVIFYYNMLDEIHDSIDDGLDNYKLLIIQKSKRDSTVLTKKAFDESNYAIRKIPQQEALKIKDNYQDTLMHMLNENEMEPVRMLTTAFQQGNQSYELRVISSMVEKDDQIANLMWSTLWLYLALLFSIILINNFVLQKLWKPFYSLLKQLKKFRLNKGRTIPDIKSNTLEFRELKSACDTLITHALEAYEQQKQFIENAAHELQTPLAVIRNKLELLMEENKLENDEAETIDQVLQMTSRLIQLNKSLLFLSKIKNKQFFDSQNLSINDLIHQTVRDLEDFTQFKNISVNIKEKKQLKVEMDPQLAHILLSNLVKNAIVHNVENGYIKIFVRRKSLTINNSAPGDKLDKQKIFQRFYNDTELRKGTGLGLAIVRAICKMYGIHISYAYADEHSFKLKFS